MNLTDEFLLANKLTALGFKGHLFDGMTFLDERREKARTMVLEVKDVIYTVRGGKQITMQSFFEHVYQCNL
jgi:hypothetical protein